MQDLTLMLKGVREELRPLVETVGLLVTYQRRGDRNYKEDPGFLGVVGVIMEEQVVLGRWNIVQVEVEVQAISTLCSFQVDRQFQVQDLHH
jgi:hypothetical protein